MILIELFLGFLWVGCFAFGGGYGAIPLIRSLVLSHGWLADEIITDMIAVSESTPGPIMVNMATYVGSVCGGVPGAILTTIAVVLPAFAVTILIAMIMQGLMKNRHAQAVLGGMKPCIIGIVLATGVYMFVKSCIPSAGEPFDVRTVILTVVLSFLMFVLPKLTKKKFSPILLIVIAAGLGIMIF